MQGTLSAEKILVDIRPMCDKIKLAFIDSSKSNLRSSCIPVVPAVLDLIFSGTKSLLFSFAKGLLLLLIFSSGAYAAVWDDIGECISNPCNCGHGTREETWHGITTDKGDENTNCPPWNKTGGRRDNTCIVQFEYPGSFSGYYMQHCAESTTSSTYFAPKIKIRNQSCNAFACWPLTAVLNWDGECVIWPTPWGLPMLRICARIALPADAVRGTPADPGYTYGKHLNFEGYEENDKIIYGVDGQPIPFDQPKLCAYKDPSAFDLVNSGLNPDILDYNPFQQPIHNTGGVHPIAKVIIFLIDTTSQTGQSLTDLMGDLFSSMEDTGMPGVNLLEVTFSALGKVIEVVGDVFKDVIKELGQFNKIVDNYHFGCVEIPMGPYPPPYCPTLLPFVPTPTTQFICPLDSHGFPIASTSNNKCVVSKLVNNSIRNSIRVSFNKLIPLCKGGEDPMITDKCVTLSNMGAFTAASGFHTASGGRDNIKPCSTGSTAPCVNTRIPFSCNVTSGGCEDGFRIVYGNKMGTTTAPSLYFLSDLPDCSGSRTSNCQMIWGINTGEFKDVTLLFPSTQNTADFSPLSSNFSLRDINNDDRDFVVSITRQTTTDPVTQFRQDPAEICVFEALSPVGCEKRIKPPKPTVSTSKYGCTGPMNNPCPNQYFTPAFNVTITDGADKTTGILQPLTATNPNSGAYNINLAGTNISSFVTDANFITKPFIGAKSINPASIYGEYKDNAKPYDSDGNPNGDAVYITGLEYKNAQYVEGGRYACAELVDLARCPNDSTNCVLANLLNNDIIDCQIFSAKAAHYPNLKLCIYNENNCTLLEIIPGKNGGSGITIKSCPLNGICYTNASNTEICKISYDAANRYIPDKALGTSLQASQYYDVNNPSGPGFNYDKSLYALRDKTSIEMNLCVPVPRPLCFGNTSTTVENGLMIWSTVEAEEESTGSCLVVGASPNKPLKRRCLVNFNSKTVDFEPLTPAHGKCQ